MEEKKSKILQVGNLIAFFGTIIINGLANALPLNGKGTGDLSDSYPNLFVPAGLTFSIWGVIYLLLAIYSFYQAGSLFKKEVSPGSYLEQIGPLFIISSAANIAWIFFWHWELVLLSLIAMLVILGSLLAIYLRLKIGRDEGKTRSTKEKWAVEVPFSVYLGWITVATIANVVALAVDYEWSGWGISEEIWTIIVIVVALIITALIQFTREDIAYSAVISWALLGIYIKRTDPEYTAAPSVATTALIGTILVLIGIVILAIRKLRK